jgi:hypothetical protein
MASALLAFGCAEKKQPPPFAAAPAPAANSSEPVVKRDTESENADNAQSPPLDPAKEQPAPPDVVAKTDDLPDQANDKSKASEPAASTPLNDSTKKPPENTKPFGEAAYFPDEMVGLIVAHPKRFFESPIGTLLTDTAFDQDLPYLGDLLHNTNLKPVDIERITVIVDQAYANATARRWGLQVKDPAGNDAGAESEETKNALKQVGYGFHYYHDSHNRFPRADGDGEGKFTGLSWRVHLLPFLEQADLYNRFKFDEPWDSEHNKTLIDQMPSVFKSPGVTEVGKTSFHVFSGENTLFHGDKGTSIREIADGSSNTILCIVAGADQAEFWTKPGGLEVDLKSPRKALGDVKSTNLQVLFADGSVVTNLPTTVDERSLALMIQPRDSTPINFELARQKNISTAAPLVVAKFARDVRHDELAKALVAGCKEEMLNGVSVQKNETLAIWFPEDRTAIWGGVEPVKQLIAKKQSGKISSSLLVEQLQLNAELTFAFNLASQMALLNQAMKLLPIAGMLGDLKILTGGFSATGREGDPLVDVIATAIDVQKVVGLSANASTGLTKAQEIIKQHPLPSNANASDKEINAILNQLASATTITTDGNKIELRIPATVWYDRVPGLLAPTLKNERVKAELSRQRQSLDRIGNAFHRFHDTFNHAPGAGRMAMDKPVGLSWRVYLLPYLGLAEADLYNQFNFDEPWDSKHNQALIAKMPDVFKSPAVEVGKTSFHVFTGRGSPFADDKTPSATEITDGLPETLLAVLAGPDTAEIWTKPGGLDFDPQDPIKALGQLVNAKFMGVMADAKVREFPRTIDAVTLRKLIQHADASPVQ